MWPREVERAISAHEPVSARPDISRLALPAVFLLAVALVTWPFLRLLRAPTGP